MSQIATPLKVGLVVLLAAVAFGTGLTLIGGKGLGRSSYVVSAVFDDASGLGIRTRVQIAGISIGQVDHVELDQDARARVFLKIDKKFKLYDNAVISKRSESILGDFILDVKPGAPPAKELEDGAEIMHVYRQPGMNEIFSSMGNIANDIQEVTKSLRKVLGNEEGQENLRAIISGLVRITSALEKTINRSGDKIDQVLTNFRDFSGDLRQLSSKEGEDVVAILKNTRDATSQANAILKTISEVVGSSGQGDAKDTIKSLKSNLEKLDKTLANVQSITDKVNKGEGTVGRLVNDDKLIKSLEKAASDVSNLTSKANDLRVEVSTRTELLVGVLNPSANPVAGTLQNATYNPWAKNYFNIRLLPRPDRWYGLEIVDDPRGYTRTIKIQNTLKDGTTTNPYFPSEVQQVVTERQFKVSAFLAKRIGHVSGRFGILESTGGFGVKVHLFDDDLTLSGDVFEFANPLKDHPRVKLYADYTFLQHLRLTAGVDDLVNTPQYDSAVTSRIVSGRDWFIGGGIVFTDDDLKSLLGVIPLKF
ncbi:MAG: MCE family protein [Deltaproteobacteria bacterium]|nr:MCE family protein [Deltaproteobacteria bacterium]